MRKTFVIFSLLSIIFTSSNNTAQGSYRSGQTDKGNIPSKSGFFIELKGEMLSVDIKDEPLKKVLKQLSIQNGITFILPPSLEEEKVMMRFSNLKVDEGLNRILGPYNLIFIYRDNDNDNNPPESPIVRLTEVRIFPHVYEGRVKEPLMRISEGVVENKDELEKKYDIAQKDKKKEREPARETLSGALKSSDRETKLKAIESLAKTGTVEDVKALSFALRDRDPVVKEEAVYALKAIGEGITAEAKMDDADAYDNGEKENPREDTTPLEEGAQSTLTLTPGTGNSAQIELANDVPVRGVQFTLSGAQPTEVRTTPRTEGFLASFDKNSGKVILVSLSGKTIAPGTGPIAEVVGSNGSTSNVSGVVIGK